MIFPPRSPRPSDREEWVIASVTAHRELIESDLSIIHSTMRALVSHEEIDAIYFGGARGGDTEALQAALYFRGKSPRPWLSVVVPDTLDQQPLNTHHWSKKANEVIELRNPITKTDGFNSYTVRDQYLVDVATFVVAFFNGNYASGTGKTVRMAEKVGLEIHKIPIGAVPR
jgi:hypothetical protein